MVYAMDTLGYAKRLRDAGVSQDQAEAHAEAARDFIMAELVTKTDLQTNLQVIKSELQTNLQVLKTDLEAKLQVVKTDLEAKLQVVKTELKGDLQAMETKLTVRLGGLMAAGIVVVATIVKML
jgi:hypothetical protein